MIICYYKTIIYDYWWLFIIICDLCKQLSMVIMIICDHLWLFMIICDYL